LEVLTHANYTLYPDIPELCPTTNLPPSHRYLGLVPWSPGVDWPEEVAQIDRAVPLVYMTLGSSGNLNALSAVMEAVRGLPVVALLATAGRYAPKDLPNNVYVAEYVPGDQVARAAALVVTNGGSSTGYQALAQGTPVLGLPSNLDQYLAMTAIELSGAGRLVRAASATASEVRAAMEQMLNADSYRESARELALAFARWDCHKVLDGLLSELFTTGVQREEAAEI